MKIGSQSRVSFYVALFCLCLKSFANGQGKEQINSNNLTIINID